MIIKYFQEGGTIPADQAIPDEAQGAPVDEGAVGQEEQMADQIIQLAQQIISQMGPDAAAMLAQAIMEILQSAQAPVDQAPAEQQFMRRGGKIVKKNCKGGKTKKACGGLKFRI